MASILFRTFGFLLILFVVIYIGTENTHAIEFRFPLLLDKPARTSAALVYFSVFAVGMFGGALLNLGSGNNSSKGQEPAARGKKGK